MELIKSLENKLSILEKEKAVLLSRIEQLNTDSSASKVFYNIYDLYNISFNNSAIPKAHIDISGKYIKVNSSFCQFFELPESEILDKSFLSYTHSDDLELSVNYFSKLKNSEITSIDFEKKYLTINGKIKWGQLIVEPFLNSKGQIAFFIIQILDITDKKNSEIAISNSISAFEAILDNMDIQVYVCNIEDYSIKFINNKSKQIFGNVIGKKCFHIFKSKDNNQCKDCEADVFKQFENYGKIKTWEYYEQEKNKWYKISERIIRWIDGSNCILIIASDITELKEFFNQKSDGEKRFKALSNSSFEAIFISENGYYIDVNKAACELFGYSHDEMIGRFGPEIFAEESREMVKQRTLSGYEEPYEAVALKKNNEIFYVEIRGKMFEYMGRQVRVAAVRDITERKKAIQALRESEEKYRNLFETSPDPIIIHSDAIIIAANKAALDFIGSSDINEIIGKNALTIVHQDYKTIAIERINALKSNEEVGLVEEKFITFKNEIRDVEVAAIPVNYDGNNAIQVVFRDITLRKNAERALKVSEEKFKNIADTAFDGIILVDQSGAIEFWNKAAENIFGYSFEEISGKKLHNFIIPTKEFELRKEIFEKLEEINFKDFNGKTFTSEAVKKDNKIIPVEVSITSFLSKGKWNAVGIVKDISKRVEYEKSIRESEQKLRELNATKDKFFSIIAHDLKNPFNQLIGFTDLLLLNIRDYSIDEIEEFTRLLNKSSKNGYRLLENLLEWSRTQTNKKPFNPENIFLKDLLLKNIELLNNSAESKNISLKINIDSQLSVYADNNMLLTILRNLISNALKFTKYNGNVEIFAVKHSEKVEISVKDNGVGMEAEDIAKLFRIDEHHSTKGTNNEGGTGIGLILCKEFVEMHSGKIWVESKINEGSTFYFTLPYKV